VEPVVRFDTNYTALNVNADFVTLSLERLLFPKASIWHPFRFSIFILVTFSGEN
jgi:hypothetical protein